jgi:hypothetical protein
MKSYKEAQLGKREALDFCTKGFHYNDSIKERLQKYKIGTNNTLDNALIKFYRTVNEYGNPVPIRIRKEEGMFNLEKLLNKIKL